MRTSSLWLAFFLSGLAGLSYELTWLRYLTQLFGASTPAVSATVAIFFSGLALGAALGARYFAARPDALRAYGLLELSIGLMALLVPLLFAGAEKALLWLPQSSENMVTLLIAAALLLLLPTILLGATFPAMAAVVKGLDNTTHATGLFYGCNTLGAMVGCLVVSFWALPALGQRDTTWFMAMINFAVGFGCLWWSRTQLAPKSEGAPEATESDENTQEALGAVHGLTRKKAYLLALVSGFCAIGIEVLWSRGLALSVAGSAYVFALILAAYLAGIGLGSLWISGMHRKARPRVTGLALLYLAACLGTLLTIHLFPKLFPATIGLLRGGKLGSYSQYLGWIGGMAVLMMLPATIAIGAALPLLIGLATNKEEDPAILSGRLYGANTLGGVAGSLLATFWIMPGIGLTPAIAALGGLYMLLAFVVAWGHIRSGSRRFWVAGFVGLLCCFFVLGQLDDINPLKRRAGEKVLFYKDTSSGTIGIYQTRRRTRILRVNNYYGLSRTNAKTRRMQYKLGLLPMLLHPKPQQALLIGFATGTTLASMVLHPQVKRARCVELHALIPSLAPYFASANHLVWKHPKVSIHQADGRRYLLRHKTQFDVIIGDLYLPRNPGVGALYSVEHFRAARQRLAKGGHFVAWLPGFQLGPDELASIIKAFLVVFPKAEGWIPHWNPRLPIIGLVGTKGAQVKPRRGLETAMGYGVAALMNRRGTLGPFRRWVRTGTALAPPRPKPKVRVKPSSRPTSQATSQPASRPSSRPIAPKTRRTAPAKAPQAQPASTKLRLLTTAHLRTWSKDAKANRLQHPRIEYAAPRSIMSARIKRFPLAARVILRIGSLRSLAGTPWAKYHQKLQKTYRK